MGLLMKDTKLDAGTQLKAKISTYILNLPSSALLLVTVTSS
jgi:hypothetical protein